MLTNASIHPTLPAVDLDRARKFYEDKLGLRVTRTDPSPGILLQGGNGTAVYLYQRGATKADHTAAAFQVDDVEAQVKELMEQEGTHVTGGCVWLPSVDSNHKPCG